MTIPQGDKFNAMCDKQSISFLGVFGSQARGDATEQSDIDVLVDFSETKSFFELSRIQDELQTIFGKKVDLVLRTHIKDRLKPSILKDLITIYEKR